MLPTSVPTAISAFSFFCVRHVALGSKLVLPSLVITIALFTGQAVPLYDLLAYHNLFAQNPQNRFSNSQNNHE